MRFCAALACTLMLVGCLPPAPAPAADPSSATDGNEAQGSTDNGSGSTVATPQTLGCGCRTAADCGNAGGDLAGAFCLSDGRQSFCAPSCVNAACPDGATCTSIPAQGAVLRQCVPATVMCGSAGGGSGSGSGTTASGSGSGSGTGGGGGGAPADAFRQHCLDQLNRYRAQSGAPPLVLDAQLDDFAQAGSDELSRDHMPHQHFLGAAQNGTLIAQAENQGSPTGWPTAPEDQQIDQVLDTMFGEGPGGGHHDNIVNPNYKRVGVGLVEDANGQLYFTNDFAP